MDIKFSVIIPLYNASNTIGDTVQSVLNQTYKNIDLIIVNDGSTDGGFDIVSKIESNNPILRCFTQSNQGVSVARNNGITHAIGDFVIFLDSDDSLPSNALQSFYDIISSYRDVELDVISSAVDSDLIDTRKVSQKLYLRKDIFDYASKLEKGDALGYLHGKCFRRELLVRDSIKFNEDISMSEDFFFNLDFLKSTGNAVFKNVVTYLYNSHDNSLMSKKYYDGLLQRIHLIKGFILSKDFELVDSKSQKKFNTFLFMRMFLLLYDMKKSKKYNDIFITQRRGCLVFFLKNIRFLSIKTALSYKLKDSIKVLTIFL